MRAPLSANGQRKSSSLDQTKKQLPEPITEIVTDNPKRVICWNHRYNAIPEIKKEVRSVSLCDSCVYPSTKDQSIPNPQSIRVRDHYQKKIACPRSSGSSSSHIVTTDHSKNYGIQVSISRVDPSRGARATRPAYRRQPDHQAIRPPRSESTSRRC